MTEYPHYARWLTLLAQRDQGALFIALIAVSILVLLVNGRFLWPRAFPVIRFGLATALFMTVTVVGLIFIGFLLRSTS